MNILKSFSNLFSHSQESQVLIGDIEDIQVPSLASALAHTHTDNGYKASSVFNGLLERIAEEFKNNIESFTTTSDIDKFKKGIQKKYKYTVSNAEFIKIYKYLNLENQQLRNLLTKKKCKSNSGVLVITVLTSAHPEYVDEGDGRDGDGSEGDGSDRSVKKARFSCKHDCAYCPNEPAHEGNNWVAQPRSYLYSEPAVLRANANDFDPIKQMNSRISSLINMGHIPDKLEIIVLGGTWSEYPRNYQDSFIRDLYYSANVYFDNGSNGSNGSNASRDKKIARKHHGGCCNPIGGNQNTYKNTNMKKIILGKERNIYKILGSRKEYIKNKGSYIYVKDYIMSKATPKPVSNKAKADAKAKAKAKA